MRTVTGAILILAAQQSFAQAHLVTFPHEVYAREILVPASIVLLCLGVGFLIWGIVTERKV